MVFSEHPDRKPEADENIPELDGRACQFQRHLRRGQRQAAVGERYSSGGSGQSAKLGQHRLPQESGKDHSRHLLDWTQSVQRHASRYLEQKNQKLC